MDNDKVTTIHITEPLSSSKIVELMDRYDNLEVITCAPSVYKRTSKTYIDALEHLEIEVRVEYHWGAKSKSNDIEFYVKKLSDEGLTAKQISQKLDITLNRVYYLLKKSKTDFDNRNRKNDHDKIKQMKKEGYSAKEISEELEIPLRTVYDILKKDKIKTDLPVKPMETILRNAGAQKISVSAKNELAKALTQEGEKIAQKAIDLVHQEGKKTVKARHIQMAIELN